MKICVQNGGIVENLSNADSYRMIAQAGFTAIDWNLDHALSVPAICNLQYEGKCIFEQPLEAVIAYYAEELEEIRKNGLTVSQVHSPFPAYVPGHPEVLDYMIGIYQRMIEYCDYAGCKNLIIHGISLKVDDDENTPESIERLNYYLYESLIPTLRRCSHVTVCLENLFTSNEAGELDGVCADPHEAVRYIDTLNEKTGREAFGLCLDVGHLHLLKKDARSYITILGKRIKALHLHDNYGNSDSHQCPMTGTVRWDHICKALHDVGYNGDLSFETFENALIAYAFDPDLLFPWLTLIRQIGESFRKKIEN